MLKMEQRGLLCILFVVCVGLHCVNCSTNTVSPVAVSTLEVSTVAVSPVSVSTVAVSPVSVSPVSVSTVAVSPVSVSTVAVSPVSVSPVSVSTVAVSPVSVSTVAVSPVSVSTVEVSTVEVSTVAVSTVATIPNSFYYNCTDDGGIEIINNNGDLSNVIVNYLNQSQNTCAFPTRLSDGSIKLSNCTKNSTVDIILEASNETGIVGGQHSKTFQIKCETVNIEPYYLNVTADETIGGQSNRPLVTMATTPTPTPVSKLSMAIVDTNKNTVTGAVIGQTLTIVIQIPGQTKIKPTVCMASGNGNDVILWKEYGCKHNEELFGEEWQTNGSVISNTMYGFRFVGQSKSIRITCTVRVCPEGYKGDTCELTCKTKRKRTNRLSDDVTMEQASTSLAITDITDPLLTSGAERLRFGLCNIISFMAAAVLVLVNAKFTRE